MPRRLRGVRAMLEARCCIMFMLQVKFDSVLRWTTLASWIENARQGIVGIRSVDMVVIRVLHDMK